MGRKLRKVAGGYISFPCPGCRSHHTIPVEPREKGPHWTFDQNWECPTLSPSLSTKYTEPLTDEEEERVFAGEKLSKPQMVCHLFVRFGRIEYLSDCTHDHAGRTIDMVDIDQQP